MMYPNYEFEYVTMVTLLLHLARLLWFQVLLWVGLGYLFTYEAPFDFPEQLIS